MGLCAKERLDDEMDMRLEMEECEDRAEAGELDLGVEISELDVL